MRETIKEYGSAKVRAEIEAEFRDRIQYIDKHGATFDRVLAAMPNGCVNSSHIYGGFAAIYTHGNAHVLAACIRALRTNGFSSTSKPEKNKAEFEASYRNDNGLHIIFTFTSQVCRRVQIGTKLVEQPVYEIVCGEMSLPG
jgi:predicted porin